MNFFLDNISSKVIQLRGIGCKFYLTLPLFLVYFLTVSYQTVPSPTGFGGGGGVSAIGRAHDSGEEVMGSITAVATCFLRVLSVSV